MQGGGAGLSMSAISRKRDIFSSWALGKGLIIQGALEIVLLHETVEVLVEGT